jgi:putative ABC transport system permease protein
MDWNSLMKQLEPIKPLALLQQPILFRKLPTAWLQLTRERVRLLVALAGISFAVILIFMQMGLRAALFDSAVRMHESLKGDVFLISPRSTALIGMRRFSERRLFQTLAFDAVEKISPIYLDFAQWRNPETLRTRQIFVVGFEPGDDIFSLSGVKPNADQLRNPDVMLFDDASRIEFGPVVDWFKQGQAVSTEVENRRLKVAGLFTMGASFGSDGNIMTSTTNFLRIFDRRAKGLIDVGLIRLKPGTNADFVVQKMRQFLPKDVRVFSKQEFIEFEKNYWQSSTAIGFIFDLGATLGLIVGIVIVYQVLYTDVSDHIKEYATLKAIGYTNGYLLSLVFQEALFLSILGFIPGFAITLGLYDGAKSATLLPIGMELNRALLVLSLTVFMCFFAGAIAVRKLRAADPADIF